MARSIAVFGRLLEPAEVVEQLAAVTLEEVRAAGDACLPGRAAVATVGAQLALAA